MVLPSLKHTVARAAMTLGYRIEQDMIGDNPRVDVFDLIVRYICLLRGGSFFFIQVGANDGITVDPIHKYIIEYHWNGILIEPQPGVFDQLKQDVSERAAVDFRERGDRRTERDDVSLLPGREYGYTRGHGLGLLQKE